MGYAIVVAALPANKLTKPHSQEWLCHLSLPVLQSRIVTGSFYRRNLPHWQPGRTAIFLTWRLYGSFPKGFAEYLRKWRDDPRHQFLSAERILDAGSSGPLWLSDPEIARCVERAILSGEQLGHYTLQAHVIMPNHVHALVEPFVSLQKLMNGIKGVSARDANLRLGRVGEHFWQDESFDHWVRDAGQFARTKMYIENNPVKARLCATPEDWLWSSARKVLIE